MATQSEIESYQQVIDGLSTVAFAQIKALLQSLDNPNPIAFRDALLATYPELMRPYMNSAAEVAAQWYTTLRTNAGISSAFTVRPMVAPTEQLEAGLRYSLSPVFQPEKFIGSDVLSMLAGFSQKMIANSGRDTIMASAVADSGRVGYARVPRAGCCAFCGLLASRGAVYNSAESAGVQSKFHDHCRCVVVPSFPNGDDSYIEYTTKHFEGLYAESIGEKPSEYSKRNPDGPQFGSRDLKTTLANWRRENGSK